MRIVPPLVVVVVILLAVSNVWVGQSWRILGSEFHVGIKHQKNLHHRHETRQQVEDAATVVFEPPRYQESSKQHGHGSPSSSSSSSSSSPGFSHGDPVYDNSARRVPTGPNPLHH